MLRDLMKPSEAAGEAGATAGEAGAGGGGHPEAGMLYGANGKPLAAGHDTYGEILAKVREFAKTNPKITAEIIKEWMAKE